MELEHAHCSPKVGPNLSPQSSPESMFCTNPRGTLYTASTSLDVTFKYFTRAKLWKHNIQQQFQINFGPWKCSVSLSFSKFVMLHRWAADNLRQLIIEL